MEAKVAWWLSAWPAQVLRFQRWLKERHKVDVEASG